MFYISLQYQDIPTFRSLDIVSQVDWEKQSNLTSTFIEIDGE